MTTSAIPWTSGAAQLRRRHRFIMFAVVGGLLAGAGAVMALVVELGWLQPASSPIVIVPVDEGEAPEQTPSPAAGEDEIPAVPDTAPVGDGSGDDTTVEEPELPAPVDAEPATPEPAAPEAATPEVDVPAAPDSTDTDASPVEKPEPALNLAQVQERLRELRYLVGPADGEPGQQTTAAVMAFQRVHDLQVDGVIGPQTLAALTGEVREPVLRGGPATRIEVDLDRQIMHLVEDGERIVTLKVSSGNGELYRSSSGGQAQARTPVGDFVVERRIHGVRNAALGTLYDPLYFHRGFAIHGSPSVPAGPASHGCVRITRADARWLIERVPNGTAVQLTGGTHVFTPSS